MGPAPPVAAIRSAVRAVLRNDMVVVACSGGADSLALAAATAFEASRAGLRAGLVTVDHGLQPDSDRLAAQVAACGYELGLDPVEVVRVEVGTAGGPEAAARTARYAALDAVAQAWDASVLLGHTLDDQAETVLLGLGRGSGPRSIVGMAEVDGRYVRPFLHLRRATTAAACAALGLEPWDDPHNADPSFQRVRLRREVLPLLEDVLQGGVSEALARTAELLRDDVEALDEAAWAVLRNHAPSTFALLTSSEQAPTAGEQSKGAAAPTPGEQSKGAAAPTPGEQSKGAGDLPVQAVASLPRALRTRVLRLWAAAAGAATPLTAERTAALDALVTNWHGQGPVQLPGGVVVRRTSGRLEAYPDSHSPQE